MKWFLVINQNGNASFASDDDGEVYLFNSESDAIKTGNLAIESGYNGSSSYTVYSWDPQV